MTNRRGRGVRGTPAGTVAEFLDHFAYTGYNPTLPNSQVARRINGVPITDTWQRAIRRWRNGQVDRVSVKGLTHTLDTFGFTLPFFHKWCRDHDLPVT